MLAKILEEMWVEPEVLEVLSEEQKKILFLKMRQEQVRRWREREQREGQDYTITRPKKASRKRVSWLLGRDGDVRVIVIGEVDEFRSSKLLQGLINNRLRSDNMMQILDTPAEKEVQQKEDIQLPLAIVTDEAAQSSAEETDSCSTGDNLEGPSEEDTIGESGGSSDNLCDCTPLCRPQFSHHGNKPLLQAQLSDTERAGPQRRETMFCEEKKPEHAGRVAQLKKAFITDCHGKPPLPARPDHLQNRSTPVVHWDLRRV
ncbi:uncharacterized protein ACBR49_007516 [Aulostomus maculatus]